MKLNKLMALALAGTMTMSLAACGGGAPAATTAAAPADSAAETKAAEGAESAAEGAADYAALDKVELILADTASNGAALQKFSLRLAEHVDAITGGQLTLDYHGNGDLGGDADLIRQAQGGDIAIVGSQIAPLVSFVPEMAIFDLPMVFAKYDGDAIDGVLNGEGETRKAINAAYEAAGLHPLGFLQNATYRLTTANRDLPDLASFKALKIRTMENANHMALWTAIGAEPTPLAWGEVYISLQNGTIEAEENAADTVMGANLQEVQTTLACTNHILYCNQLAINKDVWEELDPLYQDALNQAMQMTLDEMRPQLADLDKTSKETLASKGMKIQEYPVEFYDEILALDGVKALYQQIDEQVGGLGTTLQKELEAAK